jgi:hypothetical protein
MTNEQTTPDDGGPAFPCEWDYINSNRAVANGMTLRDYFAARAMQGELASQTGEAEWHQGELPQLAAWSYKVADAMLKARQA